MKIKELKCINKLISKDLFIDFKEYIIDNKLAKEEEFNELNRDAEKARFICYTLDQAAKNGELILLDYEWSILPIELIKITCVTEIEKREFTYGY